MLQQNGRIEQAGGMHFYEQDIVMLDYVYNGEVRIEMDIDYRAPGIGIILAIKKDDDDPGVSNDAYLFKVGDNDFLVLHKSFSEQAKVAGGSCFFSPNVGGKKMHLTFTRNGRKLTMSTAISNRIIMLGEYKLPENERIQDFRLGFYSNADNTIINATIYAERPQFWFTNIQNTNGGRISFRANAFKLEQGEHALEVEQTNIPLQPGKYWLDYQVAPVNGRKDLRCYLFPSTEKKIYAAKKNMVREDGSFTINEPMMVNILFQGRNADVSNITIKTGEHESYVSTDGETGARPASRALARLENINKVAWDGVIDAVPEYKMYEFAPYYVTKYYLYGRTIIQENIRLGEKYHYEFTRSGNGWLLSIYNNIENSVYHEMYAANDDILWFFYNLSGYIENLILTMKDGTEIDVLLQKTYKKYVPTDIDGPIIVVDEYGEPFDLSSSYRYIPELNKYQFTNWEREIFRPNENGQYILEKESVNAPDAIVLHGISDDDYDMDKLYYAGKMNMFTDIDDFAKGHDEISQDLFTVTDCRAIDFSEELKAKDYRLIVVDYLKNDSYAINKTEDGTQYEVDIATNRQAFAALYDMMDSGQVRKYRPIDNIIPIDDTYISLEKVEID